MAEERAGYSSTEDLGIPSGLNKIKTRSGPLKEENQVDLIPSDINFTSLTISSVAEKSKDAKEENSTQGFSVQSNSRCKMKTQSQPGIGRGATAAGHGRGKNVSHRSAAYLDKESNQNFYSKDSQVSYQDAVTCNGKDMLGKKPMLQESQIRKFPKGFKSYSHELGPRGGMRPACPRAHSDNDLKELLGALHHRFNMAKEEVNSELEIFAGDVFEVLEKKDSCNPEWQEKIEDLLILARECVMMSPNDFRRQCESVVQDLAEKRQQMPVGLLKQLHTRMLFILTRYTRLLQLQKESGPNQEDSIHKFKQCLKGVPSVETSWTKGTSKKNKVASDPIKFQKLDNATRSEFIRDGPTMLSGKQGFPIQSSSQTNGSHTDHYAAIEKNVMYLESQIQNKSAEGYPVDSSRFSVKMAVPKGKSFAAWDENFGSQDSAIHNSSPSKMHYRTFGGSFGDQQTSMEDLESVICRICEEEVPTSHLEPHSYICAYADRCDSNGLNVDDRLIKIAETLEQIVESYTPKSFRTSSGSPDTTKLQNLHAANEFESQSPGLSDWHHKYLEGMVEDLHEIDTASIEDCRAPSANNLKGLFAQKFEQGLASSSVGSLTPCSSLNTPRANLIDFFWLERYNLAGAEDTVQMTDLADIARCVANTNITEEGATEYLTACMQDLQDNLQHSKFEALIVETFGRLVEKLLREKYFIACETLEQKSFAHSTVLKEDDRSSTDDAAQSIMSTPTHPAHKERTSIHDFEIIKPISKGAFGKVFLARKRATGDLFAIKVLRKVDMIRKNAVENILAERNILITVRNPFVVRFFYSFTCRDNLYLVMEYLNGGDLYSLLRNVGCLDEDVVRIYIAELVLALEYLHSLGIVHRDLKPDNILIAHDGHIKLTDFGLSKLGLINSTDDLAGSGASGSMTVEDHSCDISSEDVQYTERRKNRSAVGTPDYLAPEILLGTEHGYTADWWSTGIVLFELLTGIPPFTEEHPQIIFDNILNRKIPWPSVPEDMSYEAKDLIDKSPYWQSMVDAIAICGAGFKAPSDSEISGPILIESVADVKATLEEHREIWKKKGCTIMTDGWTDRRNRTLLNFLVSSAGGTMFIKSIDASAHSKNATYLCEVIEEVIYEVGEENVVQVVTDNAANYVAAGKLLMERHPSIFWSPCAAHCIDLMLEDIAKIAWIRTCVEKAKNICKFVYNHAWVLNLMRQYTGQKELARPGITRFATNFITLQSLIRSKAALRRMLVGEEWTSSSYATSAAGVDVADYIFDEPGFWTPCVEIVKFIEPLVVLLRVADGEKPAMGYIYEGMDRAKEGIRSAYEGDESKYRPIWDIIDRRWQTQLHRPLHAAAYYLNSAFHFRPDFKADEEVLSGLYSVIERMSPGHSSNIVQELEAFSNAEGEVFSRMLCKENRTKIQPGKMLLTEDPNHRLGAKGATEVKVHPFFNNINWDTLAMQKAAFVPSPESVDDTSYFTSRHSQSSYTIQEYPESSDCGSSSTSSNSLNIGLEEGVDECGDLTEFDGRPAVNFPFSDFSFKNLSQLASINYDLVLQSAKDSSKSSPPSRGREP